MAEAKKCKHCGEWLDRDTSPRSNDTEQVPTSASEEEVPEGEIGCLILFEGLIILGVLTFMYDWSLWATFIASAVIYVCYVIEPYSPSYCQCCVFCIVGIHYHLAMSLDI